MAHSKIHLLQDGLEEVPNNPMKILFIGGTGTISSAITQLLAAEGHDLWLLNRGNRRNEVPDSVNFFPKMGRYFSAYSLRHRSAERADAPSFNDTDETSLH